METVGREIVVQPEAIAMSNRIVPDGSSADELELFQPKPDFLYSLDAAAHLAGVTGESSVCEPLTASIWPGSRPSSTCSMRWTACGPNCDSCAAGEEKADIGCLQFTRL